MWTGSENQMTLVLIRHGVTQSNKEQRYTGRTEETLTEEGRYKLQEYKRSNRYPMVQYLFTSPMERCRETAQILYPDRKAVIIPEWREIDFGVFEGKNYMELRDDKRYQAWIDSNGTLPFPNGESREEFVLRCDKGFLRMIKLLKPMSERNQNRPETVGMVVHGGTIMALLSQYHGGEYFNYQAANGGGYVCKFREGRRKPKITDIKKL